MYKPTSPAGRGTKWEWASSGKDWISYNMEVQCIIEEAWAKVTTTNSFRYGVFSTKIFRFSVTG